MAKFIPTFKNSNNNIEEAKEKLIKKIKESFDRFEVKYTDEALTKIMISNEGKKLN